MDLIEAFKAVVMGVVEGLTEFLPISSTGHLIAAGDLLGFMSAPADKGFRDLFEIVIQLGAILAVVVLFRQRVWQVVSTLHSSATSRTFAIKLCIAFVPAGIIGLATHKFVEAHLMNTGVVAAVLAVGGLAIILIERRKQQQPRYLDAMELPWGIAIAIGCCQCLSLMLPGTSRAAATILGGVLLGFDRRAATEFSFFLAIPTMFAATGYSLLKHREGLSDPRMGLLAIGFVVSFLVAWVVIAWLLRFVANHTFTAFGWYRIAAGLTLAGLLAAGVLSATGG
ncbi:MAG TPA: undecaprenyl-diphosphate phosphatase [Planctomycetota bacterium]|nr:undecaprenyl-diphosphate phosphatase [Planctomycetota bacterium]